MILFSLADNFKITYEELCAKLSVIEFKYWMAFYSIREKERKGRI